MATVVFFPEGAHGPTNNCAGIGAVLQERGHRVVFIVEESFAGTLEARGFEERLMRLGPPPDQEEAPGQFWIDFIRDTAPVFRKPTIEQLGEFVAPTFEALCDGARFVHARLLEIIDELAPDVIVEDNVVSFPALAASGRRWVRIVSCNPLELPDPALAPVFSGYPEADRSAWAAFADEFGRTHAGLHASFDEFRREAGAPPLPGLEFMDTSPYLNLYGYPDEVDYGRSRSLGASWHNVQTSVRTSDPWELPEHLRDGPGALLYLSLGSLGSADVGLMQRLVDILGATAHRVIVSKGPLGEQIRLHDNMCGEGYLPQPAILPQVDLVITHGGNNTTCEALHHGKPMVVLPLFWDQYDNAQRIHETGLGVRLSTYECADEELTGAVDGLLADAALQSRLAAMSKRLRSRSGTVVAADLIEQLASGTRDKQRGRGGRVSANLDRVRDQQRDTWDRFSDGWKKWDGLVLGWLAPYGTAMIRQARLREDSHVLDVAAGTGEPGLTVAALIPDGRVTVTDLAERMLAVAAETATRRGLRNLETRACDAGALPFADASFDAVLCRFGFMFFPDVAAAGREFARVAKPGARICAAVWSGPEKNPWATTIMGAIARHVEMPAPAPGSPGLFRCAPEGYLRDVFAGAGLRDVIEEEVSSDMVNDTPERYWAFMNDIAAPVVAGLAKADEPTRERIREEVLDLAARCLHEGAVHMRSTATIVTATR